MVLTDSLEDESNAVNLVPADSNLICEKATLHADILKFDVRSKEYRRVDLPKRYGETIISRGVQAGFRQLNGLIFAPTIRLRDGSIISQPGYDEGSGLFYVGKMLADFDRFPETVSQSDAQQALDVFDEVYSEFPFVDRSSYSAVIAANISALLRCQLETAPLFGVTAHAAGTGKSLLVDTVALITTGRRCPVFSVGHDPAEMEKRISAAVLSGRALFSLDNVEYPLKDALLCQVCSQPFISVRPLGSSTVVQSRTNMSIFATGNNLAIHGDLRRRTVLIRLDAEMEHPERRTFKCDVVSFIYANRGRIVRAALVLSLAYRAAGCPSVDAMPIGGFEQWDQWCRRPLIWAGLSDPLDASDSLREIDPDLLVTRQLLAAWFRVYGDRAVTAAELINVHDEVLRDALTAVCSEHISTRRLAGWLRRHQGRIIDGLVVSNAGSDPHRKVVRWRVESCG